MKLVRCVLQEDQPRRSVVGIQKLELPHAIPGAQHLVEYARASHLAGLDTHDDFWSSSRVGRWSARKEPARNLDVSSVIAGTNDDQRTLVEAQCAQGLIGLEGAVDRCEAT